ncbi:uncharacterized protein DUF1924 [Acidovorax sp. 62]|uniref:DUF1924 domain-containing protein n=1 Tax=Acidovorax sp. 62 TaxID=2035203 RepID=UPI000C194E28|nr:DUF1924 domain-containing protein [Acidovorax sp. 62]PIF93493.1 uncharacterized protein DUF1924 [Acidovorax sp. 62]
MNTPLTPHAFRSAAWLALALVLAPAHAGDTTAALQMQRWSDASGQPVNAERGRLLFVNRQGGEWSCASCHGNPPTAPARHASTGKAIAPLAPAFNPERFTNTAKVDKWFKRNCNDVLSRECTATEKADLLAWLLQLDARTPTRPVQSKP